MSWLTAQIGRLLDLGQEKQDAADLEQLRALLAAKPLTDGTDDAIALLDKVRLSEVVSGLKDRPEVAELVARLERWFAKAVEKNHGSNRLRMLLLPLADYCKNKQGNPMTLSWPLDSDADQQVRPDVQLKLGLRSNAEARLEVCPDLPDKAGPAPVGQSLVKVAVAGELDVKLGASLPVGRFEASAEAAASGSYGCAYYSLHAGNMRFAPAVAADMGRLETEPYDLAAVARRFRHRELHCIVLNGKGSVSLKGEIALASPVSLGRNISLGELAYGYSAILSGEFDYLVRPDERQPDAVLLHVSRRRAAGTVRQSGAKVGVDMDSAYQRIRTETLPLLGNLEDALEGAEAWLEPGSRIRSQLQQRLGSLDGEGGKLLQPPLNALLGFEPGRGVTEALVQVLSAEVAKTCADIGDSTQTSADALLDRLCLRLGLPEGQCQTVRDKLWTGIDEALADLRKNAEKELKKLADDKRAQKISDALGEAGDKFKQSMDTVDGRMAALKLLVKRYRKLAAKLYAAVEGATQLKVEASLERKTSQDGKRDADLVLRFDPARTEAQEAYRNAVLGAFETALEFAGAGGRGVEIVDCKLSRVLKNTAQTDLEVSVLGFSLAMVDLIGGDTHIDSDLSGNIRVESNAAIQRQCSLFDEKKTLRFADAFVLAAAKRARSLAIEVTFSYEDKQLDVTEAESFLNSLVGAQLMTSGSARRAVESIRELRDANPSCSREGRLDVGLVIKDAALDRLLGTDGAAADGDLVRRVAAEEKVKILRQLGASRTTESDVIAALGRIGYHVEPPLSDLILHGLEHSVGGGYEFGERGTQYVLEINRLHDQCEELAGVLAAMRQLYLTDPEEMKGWTAEIWLARQSAIMFQAADNVEGDFPSLFGKEKVRPRTLALFRIFARLAGLWSGSSGESDLVVASMTLCGGADSRVVKITLE